MGGARPRGAAISPWFAGGRKLPPVRLARVVHVVLGLAAGVTGVVASTRAAQADTSAPLPPAAANQEVPFGPRSELRLSSAEALRRVRAGAPELRVARDRESIARADVGVAGVLPNPIISAATNTQSARLALGASLALPILGQRGATIAASRADLETAHIDTEVIWTDVRAAAGRAYVALWLAQERAAARREGSVIASRLDAAVAARVELGAAPEVDGLRTRAERLRAEADAREAEALVDAAASQLAFYLTTNEALRADGEYGVPTDAPPLPSLTTRLEASPIVRRENSDARAADARVSRERALARPTPVLDLGADIGDPTLPTTNYRAGIALDVPLLSMRGAQIDRERANAAAARSRASLELARNRAGLTAAYHTFVGADARAKMLAVVLVAADAASRATEESYQLGRAQLVAVLDASRTRLDTRITLAEAIGTRAQAWIDIERAIGAP